MAASSVVGVDIGSSQIKAVQVERNRDRRVLVNAAVAPTPPESVQDGMILDVSRVTDAVRQLLRDNRMPASDAVAAVSGSHVLVRPIKVPDINPATLKRSIRFEAAKYLDQGTTGVSIENSAVEYEVLGRSGQPPQLDVLIVVAPMPMVNGRVQVLEGAGLEAVAVDVEAFALLRAMEAAGLTPAPGQAAVVMNMGATYTDLNIVVGSEVVAPRSIPIGGNALTSSLASVLNVPVDAAEEHKRHVDIAPAPPHGDEGHTALLAPDPARQVALPFVDELIRELRRSILYYQSQAAEAGLAVSVEHVILCGGGTQLSGLPAYLRERLGMAVTPLDPLTVFGQDGSAPATGQGRGADLAVALGLALKEYN